MQIAHSGTFDVANYGDLLFPMLVADRLPDARIAHVSPAGAPPVWGGCVTSCAFDALLDQPLRALVIGGGNVIHTMQTTLDLYRRRGVGAYGYADLWASAALALPPGVPVLWNTPGVPERFETAFLPMVRAALRRADYLSVRDEESRDCLLEVEPDLDVAVVPDSAWDLPRLWRHEDLAPQAAALLSRLGASESERFFVGHVNARYFAGLDAAEVAALIDELSQRSGARALLIAIGPCHGDDLTTATVAARMTTGPLVLTEPATISEITAAIAGAAFYCGSSMHGYITAAAYGVPAVTVASGRHKFAGLVRLTSSPETLVASWPEAVAAVLAMDLDAKAGQFRKVGDSVRLRLDAHWQRIRDAVLAAEDHVVPAAAFHAARARQLDAATAHYRRLWTEASEILGRVSTRQFSSLETMRKVRASDS